MARAPKLGKCVHCLRDPVRRNWDHVFPKAWYPTVTKPNEKKWQIPTCIDCNEKYGKLESDFLIRIGHCLDPHDPASADIVKKTLRALNPLMARNSHDRKRRTAALAKLRSQIRTGEAIPRQAIIPGMGDRWGTPPAQHVGIPIPKESMRLLTEKIVRGIFYVEDGLFIEPPFKIEMWVLPQDGPASAEWKDALNRYGRIYERKPGVMVHRAVVPADKYSSLFEIIFWGQFKMYASVTNGGFELPVKVESDQT